MAITKKSTKKPLAAKKPAPKKVAKAVVKAKAPAKKAALTVKEPFTKSQIIAHLCNATELKKKDISALFDAVTDLMEAHLSKKGPGEFNLVGLLKCRVIHKPPTKARNGVNPFTGQPTVFPAKPARNVLKVRPLKKLKELVA
ncbi:MAG TPA: HU family DNA-binding protein [Gammaproteobacteria bacterium]|nr:HU family DNA-binding protein [Gammaproteobacteria bacterium]